MDRGVWWTTIYGVTESDMTEQLTHTHTHTHTQKDALRDFLSGAAAAVKSLQLLQSLVFDSVQLHRQQPTRLLCPWDFPGKSNKVGCHCLLHLSGARGRESACQCRRLKGCWFDARFGKIPWRSKCETAVVFLPGKFHGKKSLAGYSPWGLKESDIVEQLSTRMPYMAGICEKEPQYNIFISSYISSVAQSCPTICDPMNHSTPGLPVHHQLPKYTQTHVLQVGDAIQPSHPL